MTPAAIALAVLKYGPSIIPLLQQLGKWISEKKETVSPEDFDLLVKMASKRSIDYLKEAGLE